MKIFKKLINRGDKIVSFLALLSMLVNALSPFAAVNWTKVYAEEVSQSSSSDETVSEEPSSTEVTNETSTQPKETIEEVVEETPTQKPVVPVQPEVSAVATLQPTPVQEVIPKPIATPVLTPSETQPGDILPDGVSDYRPEVDIQSSETAQTQESIDPNTLPSDTASQTPDPIVSEEPVSEPVKEYVNLDQNTEIKDSENSDWEVSGNVAQTTKHVQLGIRYVFPLDKNVTITFTKLPALDSDRSNLRIERVEVSDLKLPEGTKTDAKYAFDITTNMKDGEFEYSLSLPKPEGIDAGISYVEKSIEEAKNGIDKTEVKTIEGIKQESNEVKVEDLDHFTIYIATYSDGSVITTKETFAQTETVYAKAIELSTTRFYKIEFSNPASTAVFTSTCTIGNTNGITSDYTLPFDAAVGTWKVTLLSYAKNDCSDKKNEIITATQHNFSVITFVAPMSVITSPISINSVCLEDAAKESLNCTANDISLATVPKENITILDDGCASPDDTVTFSATWNIQSTSTERYDVGLYFATDGDPNGDGARKGLCSVSTLPNSPVPPWFNYDTDSCGDIGSGVTLHPTITMTVQCIDNNANNALDVPYCASWDNQAGGVCNGPTDAIPNTKAKCGCNTGFEIPIVVPYGAKIEVIKNLSPSNDPGTFNLQIDGSNQATCVGNGGSTGVEVVSAGTSQNPGADHTVGETACGSTNTNDYTTTITCVNRGTSTVVASGSGTGPITVHTNKDQDIVCTISNSIKHGTLIVKKVVINDNGGTKTASDFSFSVNGANPVSFEADGQNDLTVASDTYNITEPSVSGYSTSYDNCSNVTVASGGTQTCTITNNDVAPSITLIKEVTNNNGGNATANDFGLKIGGTAVSSGQKLSVLAHSSYALTETGLAGYSFVSITGAGCPSVLGGTVTLNEGQNITCTITNDDDAANLTVVKTVKNDNGGTKQVSDFKLYIDGNSAISGTPQSVLANIVHTVSEDTISGYTPSVWGGDCSSDGKVTLLPGQSKTCTITNDDVAPTLTLVKILPNDNGGNKIPADFNVYIDSSLAVWGSNTITAGVHSVSEDILSGYVASSWGGDCSSLGLVTLNPGDNKTCTITNDDQAPTITLIKSVINNNGGAATANDFGLTIGGNPAVSGISYPVFAHTSIAINEAGLLGYSFVSVTGAGCPSVLGGTVNLNEGQNITCTITNDDQAAHLTVIKHVINNNGGTKSASDFTLGVTGDNASPSSFNGSETGTSVSLNAGSYSVDETEIPGYTKTLGTDCSGTISNGESKTCTITNDDQAGKLIVKKVVVNDNGGTKAASDFSFSINGQTAIAFESDGQNDLSIDAGIYSITEPSVSGYSTSYDNCSRITIANGGVQTCTITNNDQPAKIVLVKHVTNDNGGRSTQADFPVTLNGNAAVWGDNAVDAGTYTASEEEKFGYLASDWTGDCNSEGTVTLLPGEVKTCDITNDDIQPKLTITKIVDNKNFGTLSVPDFPLYVNGIPVESGVQNGFNAGIYAVSEVTQSGYTGVITGDCASDGGITLGIGEVKACTITNTSEFGKIIIEKITSPDNDETRFEFNGTGVEKGTFLSDGQTTEKVLIPGTYSVTEVLPSDWTQTDLVCDDPTSNSGKSAVAANTSTIDLASNETVTCHFYNTKLGSISGFKYNDEDGNGVMDSQVPSEFKIAGWGIDLYDNSEPMVKIGTTTTDALGAYTFNGLMPGTYNVCEVEQTNWFRTEPSGISNCKQVVVAAGDTISNVDFGNFQGASITACKYVDEATEGQIPTSLYHGGWTVNLLGGPLGSTEAKTLQVLDTKQTSTETGCYTWSGLKPNYEYSVTEEMKDYWQPNGPTQCNLYNLMSGNEYTCNFHNVQVSPTLYISKSNDTGGSTMNRGDIVTFTITVRTGDTPLDDVKVKDLPSVGFTYVPGSAQIDGHTLVSASEPHYASPGTWNIGDMDANQTKTLTYEAKIGDGVDSGTYKDLAWAYGTDNWDGKVIDNSENLGIVNDVFVGTAVKVDVPIVVKDTAEVKTKTEHKGEVLGISTLPDTGIPANILRVILGSAFVGGLMMVLGGLIQIMSSRKNSIDGKKLKKLMLSILMLGVGILLMGKTMAASSLTVLIEDPKTTARSSFNITFVAMDTDASAITAQCQKQGPSDSDFVSFGPQINVLAGGNSYNCNVDSSVLTEIGDYDFRVKAWTDNPNDAIYKGISAPVSFDNTRPDTPKYIEKDRKSSCKYEVTLKTADDGQTSYIWIYRDDSKDMELRETNKIKEKTIGPDEKYTFTDEVYGGDCNHTQYYAVIAFNSLGNPSDPRAEADVHTITTKTTIKKEESGALEVVGGANLPAGGETTSQEPAEGTTQPTGGEEGNVLGQTTTNETSVQKSILKSPWFWLIIVIVGIITVSVLKRRKKK